MDWTVGRISDYESLHPAEHVALQLRKRTNRYVAFARVAFWTYKVATYQEKSQIIANVTGEESYPDDVSVVELVRTCWANMPEDLKDAWEERSVFLNSLPVVGEFNNLPNTAVLSNLDEMTKYCFRSECDMFKAKMKGIFLLHNEKNKKKKQVLMLPQEVAVGHKMHRSLPMSTLLRCVLFGKEKLHANFFHPYEDCCVSSKKIAPAYLHFSSPKRLNEIMTVGDVKLTMHESFDLPGGYCEHTLTSVASITDESGRMFKAYGWKETRTSITFVFNNRRAMDPIEFLTFRRPEFAQKEKLVVTNHGIERLVRYHEYDFSSVPPSGEYNLVGYVPVCLRVHSKNLNSSFSFVGGRIAYRKINNDDIYLLAGYTS